ncbi:MAG: response regulator [Bacteroidota bacterium]
MADGAAPQRIDLLVVDDEPEIERLMRMALRRPLRKAAFDLHVARDGVEALDLLAAHDTIGVVLTDLNMPHMDGLTLLDHLRDKAVRVVVVSAYGDLPNIRAAMNRGAYDFLTKPFDRADLLATVEKALGEVAHDRETAWVRRQLAQAQQALTVADEVQAAKTRFFADLSHEIRTPLTLILGPLADAHAAGAVQAVPPPEVRRMMRNARRLNQLIDQFLDLAKVDAARLTLRASPHDLAAFVAEVVYAFQPGAERRGLALRYDAPASPLLVYFEPDKVEKVVANLLSNALKFTPAGGHVRVRVAQEGERAVLSVRDTGPGIAPEAQAHLFERFYQASPEAAPRGVGIGLALAHALVQVHHGALAVASEPGFGSTFTVTLPLGTAHLAPHEYADADEDGLAPVNIASDVAVTTGEASREDRAPVDAPCVVVIDDHDDVRAYIAQHLRRAYRVEEASDGEAGLALVREHVPALVVCDVRMPGISGVAVCKAIRADPALAQVPVILLTAQADEASRLVGLAAGADAYLPKPFNADELRIRAENLIELRRRLATTSAPIAPHGTAISVEAADTAWLTRLRDAIEAQMHRPGFKVGDAADEVGVSARHLRRKLRDLTDLSPSAYVRMLRMDRAAQLLAQQAGTVSEVAYRVGYLDAKYFSQQFRQVFGVNPSAYGGENGRPG